MSDEEEACGEEGGMLDNPPHLPRFDQNPSFQRPDMLQYMASILEQNSRLMAQLLINTNLPRVPEERNEIQVKPDVSVSIPAFNGEEDDVMASEWLSEFNRIADLSRWTSRDKLTVASMKMVASAKDWHRTEGIKCADWDAWELAFREAFVKLPDAPERWQQMVSRKQGRDENVVKYIREKAKLCDRLNLSKKDTLGLIIRGLWSRALSYAMRDKAHKDVNELIKEISDYEAFGRDREQWFGREKGKPNSSLVERTSEGKSTKRFETARSQEVPRPKTSFSAVEKTEKVRCYNCQSVGHYASSCTSPRKLKVCYKCGGEGHFKKDCPGSKMDKSTLCASTGVSSTAQGKTLSVAMSVVDERSGVPAFVDTGSQSSFMKLTLAASLGKDLIPSESTELVKGFGGGTERPIGRVTAKVSVNDVCVSELILYVVRDDAYEGPDILLGRSFIDRPNVTMLRREGATRFLTKEQSEPFSDLMLEPEVNRIALRATEDVKIEPGFVAWIKVASQEGDAKLVKWESPSEYDHEIVYELVEGKTTLPVMNYSDEILTIKQNQIIQRVRPVREMDLKESEEVSKEKINVNSVDNLNSSDVTLGGVWMNEELRPEESPITVDEIRMGQGADQEKREEFCRFLNKYRKAFSFTMKELGCTDVSVMKIREVDGSKPVSRPPYPASRAQREALKKITEEMLQAGLIRESESEYSSPVLMVKKKQPGEYRMVVDYRRLNSQTIKDKYPIARMDDVLEKLAGYELYTTLDMAHGYFQIPLAEDSIHKAAFTTPEGHYEPLRMFFGLTNGPPVYQRMVARMLSGVPWGVVCSFFDDLAVPGRDWKDMYQRLGIVFEAIISAGLTLRLSKCIFGEDEVEFLGFVISKKGIRPGPAKLEAIRKMKPPTDVHGVRRFMGLMSFFRRFIPQFAQIAAPLTNELRHKEGAGKPKEIVWTEEHQRAFDDLRGKLLTAPVLSQFDPTRQTELHTDASSKGLAGMLLQRDADSDKWQLVFCVSRRTTEGESKYHSSRLELMAIVWCVDKLRSLLLGIHFTIVTDCAAIVYINTQKSVQPQVARWVDRLQEYDFELKYRPGIKMAHVDCLSRAAVTEAESEEEDSPGEPVPGMLSQILYTISEEDKILMIQKQDQEIKQLITLLQKKSPDRTKEEKHQVGKYRLKNGLLHREVPSQGKIKLLFVIPRTLRKYVLVKNHDFGGHFAVDATVEKIQRHYWFPKMRAYTKQHISQCFECLFHKLPGGKKPGELNPISPGKRPFEIVHMDHLGPFITSKRGNTHVLVLVDNLTKFIVIQAYPNTKNHFVMKFLTQFVDQYGLPSRIITDRGTCFTSQEFLKYCTRNGVKHTLTSTQRAQANGQVERINRELVPAIASHIEWESHKDWDLHLPRIAREINDNLHKSTGCTPFELLHGYTPSYYPDALQQHVSLEVEQCGLNQQRDKAREKLLKCKEEQKSRFDKRRCPAIAYNIGDVVVVRRQAVSTGVPTSDCCKGTASRYLRDSFFT